MKPGFLLSPKKKKGEKDNGLGLLQDKRSLPPSWGGLVATKSSTWREKKDEDRLGRGSKRWVLPESNWKATGSTLPDPKEPELKQPKTTERSLLPDSSSSSVPPVKPPPGFVGDPIAPPKNTQPPIGYEVQAEKKTLSSSWMSLQPMDVEKLSINDDNRTVSTMSTTQASSTVRSNPYARMPMQPIAPGCPKDCLHALFGKPPRNKPTTKSDFYTWHRGQDHMRQFTSIFVCPLTGECFTTGRYGDAQFYTLEADPVTGMSIVWYTRKIYAEHGAAARAFDCISFRECPPDKDPPAVGEDAPYSPHAMPLPSMTPPEIRTAIQQTQDRIRKQKEQTPMQVEEQEKELAWESRPYEVDLAKDLFG